MPIRLSIEAETVEEFDTLLGRFARSGDTAFVAPAPATAAAAEPAPAPTPAKRGSKKAAEAAAPTQNPDGTPIAPVSDPVPQPTPGGTDAPPAESIPPNQQAADPMGGGNADAAATASPAAESPASGEQASATPAATSPADQAAAAAGEVTVQNLKDAMADLLKVKSASFAMKTLEEVSGCKSLTTGSPSVVEKAKDDPALLRHVLDALVAAKA